MLETIWILRGIKREILVITDAIGQVKSKPIERIQNVSRAGLDRRQYAAHTAGSIRQEIDVGLCYGGIARGCDRYCFVVSVTLVQNNLVFVLVDGDSPPPAPTATRGPAHAPGKEGAVTFSDFVEIEFGSGS